jgi:hypothetical protein
MASSIDLTWIVRLFMDLSTVWLFCKIFRFNRYGLFHNINHEILARSMNGRRPLLVGSGILIFA